MSWGVRPKVAKVNIKIAGTWLKDNIFAEGHTRDSHNLVINPDLLSTIGG